MTDTTRELAFGCENLGLAREETIDRIARAAKELELVEYLNRSILRYPAEKTADCDWLCLCACPKGLHL